MYGLLKALLPKDPFLLSCCAWQERTIVGSALPRPSPALGEERAEIEHASAELKRQLEAERRAGAARHRQLDEEVSGLRRRERELEAEIQGVQARCRRSLPDV